VNSQTKLDALAVALAADLRRQLGLKDNAPDEPSLDIVQRKNWPVAEIINSVVEATDGSIPIRIYRPSTSVGLPVLVYIHGGGWFSGDLDAVDANCRELCARAECIVVSVDYSLSPENKFPRALSEVNAVSRWVSEHATSFGGDSRRLAVGGESAGATLAAAECLLARSQDGPRFLLQLLVYPVLDPDMDRDEIHRNQDPILSTGLLRSMWRHYTDSEQDFENSLVAPLRATSMINLPRAVIVTGGTDPLRKECAAFGAALRADGVFVQQWHYEGLFHGFFGLPHPRAESAFADVVEALRDAFALRDPTQTETAPAAPHSQ
jgi:acetyl esterase